MLFELGFVGIGCCDRINATRKMQNKIGSCKVGYYVENRIMDVFMGEWLPSDDHESISRQDGEQRMLYLS